MNASKTSRQNAGANTPLKTKQSTLAKSITKENNMEVAWIIGGFAIGFVVMKLASKLIDYIEKVEDK
jgi:hypothetical protein